MQVTDQRNDELVACATIPISDKEQILDLFSVSCVTLDVVDAEITLEDSKHWSATATLIDVPKGRVGWIIKSHGYDGWDYLGDGKVGFWPGTSRDRLRPTLDTSTIYEDYDIIMTVDFVDVDCDGDILVMKGRINVLVEHGCGNGCCCTGDVEQLDFDTAIDVWQKLDDAINGVQDLN